MSDRGTIAELALLPLSDVEELAWQEKALCAQTDPEAFFPEKGGSTREAKRVCLSCDVRDDCLEYALANDERFRMREACLANTRNVAWNASSAQCSSLSVRRHTPITSSLYR